ncbi:hypothetical protein Tco_0120916 [Tanacetum coccineum]
MLRVFPISLNGATSRWLRNEPTISIKTWEDLKTKFLNIYCPPGRTVKKIEEINNFQQEPDETLYQAWERFKELLMKCPQHYLIEMQEVILFYNGLDVPTRQILDSRGVVSTMTAANAKKGYRATTLGYYQRNNTNSSYQERRQSMEDTLSKFMSESVKRHEENSNLIKEIRVATNAAIRNQGASIKTLEIQIGKISNVLQERGFGSLLSSTDTNPKDQVKSIPTTIEADSHSIRRIGSPQYAKRRDHMDHNSQKLTLKLHISMNPYPQKEKDLGIFTLHCFINNVCFDNALVDLGASISVMPLLTYLNLGLGELAHTKLTVKLAYRTVKYPKEIAENVLVRIGKFTFPMDFIILDMPEDIKVPLILGRPFLSTQCLPAQIMELDLEARLMGETLVLNRSLDPFLEDYIELNDLNEPFKLRRNQCDDLMPTIEEGKVIEEFRTRDEDLDTGIDDYPSYCDDDKKIHIDCAHNLKFSCMIGFEFTHVNFFPLLYVNVMSKKFHNSIMKDKMVYKGDCNNPSFMTRMTIANSTS